MLKNNGDDVHTWIIFMSDYMDDLSFSTVSAFWVFCNFNNDFMSFYCTIHAVGWNENVVRDSFVVSNYKTKFPAFLKRPYYLSYTAFKAERDAAGVQTA